MFHKTIFTLFIIFVTILPKPILAERSEQGKEVGLMMIGPAVWGAVLMAMTDEGYGSLRMAAAPEYGIGIIVTQSDWDDGVVSATVDGRSNGMWWGLEYGHEAFRLFGRTNFVSFGTEYELGIALQRAHCWKNTWPKEQPESVWHPRLEVRFPYERGGPGWRSATWQIAIDWVY